MMSSFSKRISLRLALLFALPGLCAASPASAGPPMEVPPADPDADWCGLTPHRPTSPREDRPFALTVLVDGLFYLEGDFLWILPMPALRATWQPSPRMAVDLQLSRLEGMQLLSGGVRAYLADNVAAPFLDFKTTVEIEGGFCPNGHCSRDLASTPALAAGLGTDFVLAGPFFLVEAVDVFVAPGAWQWAARLDVGIGCRF